MLREIAGGTGGADNNSNTNNAYAKAGLSTYNVAGVNTDAGLNVGNTSGTEDASGTGVTENNTDSKNAYAKADLSIYIVVGASAGVGTDNAIVTVEKVGSNINNTDID